MATVQSSFGQEGDMRRVAMILRAKANRWVRAIVLEGDRRIRMRTPVKSGRARGNWHISVGEPDWHYDPERMNKGVGRAGTVPQGIGEGSVPIFVCNGLPYIGRLEYGWSKQAPQGMVRLTAKELRLLAARIAAKIRGESPNAGGEVGGAG